MKNEKNEDFEKIWKEMEKIEPLTPIITTTEEHDESIDGTSPNIHPSTT